MTPFLVPPRRRRYLSRAASVALLVAVSLPAAALAQGTGTHADSSSPRPFFSSRDALIAAGFAGATIALFPLDKQIAHYLETPATQRDKFLDHAATGFELIASPGAYVIGGGLYAVGRLAHLDRAADLGLHGTEAVLLADGVTGVLKLVLGRSRPFVTADSNPRDFQFDGGFKGDTRQSFPSGHTTTAFAAAAAVTAETGSWWPHSTWVIGPLMYGGATMVGLGRMYHNKHWASDVALGAAIGTFSGQKLVQFLHTHPHNALDRALLRTALMPDGHGGFAVSWSATTR
jgi:membrane-associated phospholipid phosphatase